MASSNNVHASIGNSETHSFNTAAAPIIAAATPVIVEVPGPTVYVDVPGPTQYVDVPGPTVHVNVPGPTVYIDKSLLAEFDFSQIPDQNLKVDGDYQIPVTGGSTSATTATIKAVKCAAGIGATGIQRIKSGKLEFLPDVITSELGLQYWSNIAVPMLGIDLRTLSTKLQADTYFQQVRYEVVAEIDPLWLNGTAVNQQTAYAYIEVGFLHNLDLWAANGTPRPQGNFTGYRHTTAAPIMARSMEIGGIAFGPSSFMQGSYPQGSMQNATAPFNTFFNNSSTKLSADWNTLGGSTINVHSNGSTSLTRSSGAGNMNIFATYSVPSTFTAGRTTNNLWMVAYCSRSTSSIQANDVPFRIKKISIFERSL
jgi:hypothetical protein